MSKKRSKTTKPPVDWEKYTNMGRQVPGTKFIPFKTPLKEELLNALRPPVDYFDTRTMMDHCSALGLVIDLTNVSRYYNFQDFVEAGIHYEKLETRGHAIPARELVTKFAKIVENFLEENEENDRVIGVHCTHGVNRTGYMICRYMIEQLGVPPDQALADFKSARGHEIERKNYVDHLLKINWASTSACISPNVSSIDTSQSFTEKEKGSDNSGLGDTPPYMPHRSRRRVPTLSDENDERRRYRSRSPSFSRTRGTLKWESEQSTPELSRGSKRSASTERGEREANRKGAKSPRLGKEYYNQYFKGQVHHQYDSDFYRRGGGGIGPHRPPPRYLPPVQGDGKHPRQYRGPRPYRSPPREVEPVLSELKTPNQKGVLSPPDFCAPTTSSSNLETPNLARVDGPIRNPLSPGATTNVFSPENEFGRRRSSRFQPY